MEANMRRLLTFECADEQLSGSLDEGAGDAGVLMVMGGTQTRVGSHRMYERLANALAERDFPCFRYDRRGVGDSSGDDPGFRDSELDLEAAAEAFRSEAPEVERVIGFGLCDGATTLALHGAAARLDGLILVNPWLVEAEAGEMAPAAVRAHYRERLLSGAAWKKLLTGGVNLGKLIGGVRKAGTSTDSSLAGEAALGLVAARCPVALILATGDNTAIAAAGEIKKGPFEGLISWSREIDTDSHTFARPGDQQALEQAVLEALAVIETGRSPQPRLG
jgi:exosortase A-associated hydrolase 1